MNWETERERERESERDGWNKHQNKKQTRVEGYEAGIWLNVFKYSIVLEEIRSYFEML